MSDTAKTHAPPKTYGRNRTPYKADRCAEAVRTEWGSRQCERRPGHGPEAIYCKAHAAAYAEATATWWRVYGGELSPAAVVSVSELTLLLKGGVRRDKSGTWGRYFPTWREAADALGRDLERQRIDAERALTRAVRLQTALAEAVEDEPFSVPS